MDQQFIIVAGNISEGFEFIGPFECFDDADQETQEMKVPTWIATLESPLTSPTVS